MTFVGKILVIVIMAFSLLFLGTSVIVFSTAENWKKKTGDKQAEIKTLTTKNTDLTGQVEVAKKDLEKAKSDHKTLVDAAEKRITDIQEEIKRTQAEITDARTKFEVAQQSANTALAEAKQRLDETLLIREQKSAVEKQANEFKVQQTELNDKIRELERLNGTLDANTKDLRDRVARYSTLLRRNGLSDDITTVKGLDSPPSVDGEVAKVDGQNSKVEITIGSNDGIVPGHELFLYRTKPRAQYLGKIKILSTDPQQAVGKVIGNTIQGMKIQEGDHGLVHDPPAQLAPSPLPPAADPLRPAAGPASSSSRLRATSTSPSSASRSGPWSSAPC